MRVVLRQEGTGLYLQPDGTWSLCREQAREFISASVAYWWAMEQRLLRAEVWLAYANPKDDFACMKIEPGSKRPVIDCAHTDWKEALHSHLYNGIEADLINFQYTLHGEACELLAQAFAMEFQLDRDPSTNAAHFRKRHEWRDSTSTTQRPTGEG